jgi:transcriptional regulator with XRE-family HTH domain
MAKAKSLLQITYDLLDSSDLTYRQIAEGAGVDVQWFAKFKQRRIPEPGVSKVQRIHDFLSTKVSKSVASDRRPSRRSVDAA